MIKDALYVIGPVITIVLLVVGAIALVTSSYRKSREEDLEKSNAVLRTANSDLTEELSREQQSHTITSEKLLHVEQENQLLLNMITQRAEFAIIAQKLDEHHKEAKAHWQLIAELLKEGNNGPRRDSQ